ncbi:unnamed protein product [Prorocentrum cordatum]|uniref:Uncharacterized protein n=1 Tax=Prorocentrum cordatum TaxID=2364126 RepID=A0ABN9W4K2_9DINO|nr:unnamed protein product [Polarella glacialis]
MPPGLAGIPWWPRGGASRGAARAQPRRAPPALLPLPLPLLLLCGAAAIDVSSDGGAAARPASFWRIVNTEEVEIAWRVRSLQFFSDDGCTKPVMALANEERALLSERRPQT